MPVTGLRGRQILDGDVFRNDLNITTTGSAVTRRIVAGTGITISSTGVDTGTGDVTINASGVTSVGLALPNIFSITGSPVTTSGTLTGTFVSQTANTIFAAPNGSAGTPTFRALVAADIPALTLENLPDAWVKRSVRVATTANITLSGTQTIDGVAVVAGDRVLVKDQTTSANNGIYLVAAGAWTRSTDADTASEIAGSHVNVDSGTINGGLTYDNDFKATDTLGTTGMPWFRVIDTGYGQALTKTDDTNVTLTLGGTPSTALIQPASLTLGWAGQLSVGRGGTGASTLTGVLIGNGTGAITGVTGTASQLLRRNAGNTAYEFFTFSGVTGSGTSGVIPIWNGTSSLANSIINYSGSTLQINSGTETFLNLRGDGQGYTQANIVFQTGTNTLDSPQVRGLGSYYFNEGNDVIWYFGNAYGGSNTDTLSILRLSTATFNGAAADPAVGTRLFYIDVNKSVFLNQIQSQLANNTAQGGGQIYLNGATGNRIDWNTSGISAPTLTTRSVGTKLVLYPGVNASQVDYGFGIDSDTLWASVASTGGNFKWYGATQVNMKLVGNNLVVGSDGAVASKISTYSSAAGQSIDGITVTTSNTSVGLGHASRFYTDTLADGVGRTLIYAASYNNTNTRGQLDILTESGGAFISRLGIGTTGTNNTYSVFDTSGIEAIRLNTTGNSWLLNGNVSIGSSTSAAKLYVKNTVITNPTIYVETNSSLTTLQDTIPLRFDDLYQNGSFGHNLIVNSTASSGVSEYNITKTWSGILTLGVSTNGTTLTRQLYLYSSGQLRLSNYTTTSSFTGTAVGVLAFTSDGSIITIATPGGGSGITGTGNQNYITKFSNAGATSIGNSVIFDNGTDIGINTATPTTLTNYKTIDFIGGSVGALIRFSDSTATFRGAIYGSTAEMGINAVSTFNLYVNSTQIVNASTTTIDVTSTSGFAIGNRAGRRRIQYASSIFSFLNDGDGSAEVSMGRLNLSTGGQQLQIGGGTTTSGIFQGASNLLNIADWTTASNGIVIDVSNGILYSRASAANGSYIAFQRNTSIIYGYVGNSAQLFNAGFNANTDLGIRSEGAINFGTGSTGLMRLQTTGQLRLVNYTTTTSFTGTVVGVLAFDASGNILTAAMTGSQWITNGTSIYYSAGNVGIGTNTTPADRLEISTASGTAAFIRFNQATRATWRLGQNASTDDFVLLNHTATTTAFQISSGLQLRLNAYTSITSFTNTPIGQLGFDSTGNIITVKANQYRIDWSAQHTVTLTNLASALQFYNNQNGYITKADLTGFRRVRLLVQVVTAGTATTFVQVRYRTTYNGTAANWTTSLGTSEVRCQVNAVGVIDSGWIDIAVGAKADVWLALLTVGGDGAADPQFGAISMEFQV